MLPLYVLMLSIQMFALPSWVLFSLSSGWASCCLVLLSNFQKSWVRGGVRPHVPVTQRKDPALNTSLGSILNNDYLPGQWA